MTLNIKLASDERLKAVSDVKKITNETLEDAWTRILSGKNSATDQRRLLAVREAMVAGDIEREPSVKPKRFSKAEALRLYAVLAESQKESKLEALVKNMPASYVLVTQVEALDELIAKATQEKEIAVDTETTGLDVYTDVIVGVSITLPSEDKHYYVPFQPTNDTRALDAANLQRFKPLMESEQVGKVLHNAIYDMAMFKRHGITLSHVVWDTQTAMHLLNENENYCARPYALKNLATKYLNEPADTFDELFGKNAKFAEIPLDIALAYAAKDTELTWRLYQFQREQLEKFPEMLRYYREIEVPLLSVIVDLEANGYVLDLDFAREYGAELKQRAEKLERGIKETLGNAELNINSNQQMADALGAYIGKELPNMQKNTLKRYAADYPIISDLLEYRKIMKLYGTYIDAIPKLQNPTTKRWHSRFNPMGTVTGRFSSGKDEDSTSGFNVQNQSPESRRMFRAPEGKVLIGADFKAQEIRCVASLSKEPALIEAFEKNLDPYAMLAVKFTGLSYDECYKNEDGSDTAWRKKMKVAWLAWLYGAAGKLLAEWLGTTKDEAERFMSELKASLPVLSEWLEGNTDFVRKNGYVWCDKKQRKRRLPAAKWRKKNIPWGKYWDDAYKPQRMHNAEISKAERQATNARVQGSSSIQTKKTMLVADRECKKRDGWALWGTVHDELIFELPIDFTREDAAVIENIMLNGYTFDGVANGTDLEVMTVWGEGVTLDEWFKNKEAK